MQGKRKRIRTLALTTALLLANSGVAGAAFFIDRTGVPPDSQFAEETVLPLLAPVDGGLLSSGVVHRGTHPASIPPAVGMGRDIGLRLALRQVVPDGFTIRMPEVYADEPVSWSGAESWPAALGGMMNAVQGQAVIDWDSRSVHVFVADQQERADKLVRDRGWDVLVADQHLGKTFQRWAHDWEAISGERWQIMWDAPQHIELGADATIHGNFEQAITGTLESLVGSGFPLEAWIYENGPQKYAVRIVPLNTKSGGVR